MHPYYLTFLVLEVEHGVQAWLILVIYGLLKSCISNIVTLDLLKGNMELGCGSAHANFLPNYFMGS